MQFLENLTDRQAADAVRSRIDWKYLLGLELTDPGFDFSILSEFRDRLLEGEHEQLLLDTMLERLQECGLLKVRGRQRTDSTHILSSVRSLNRLELVGRTVQHALNTLALKAPDWLRALVTAEWFDRYSRLIDEYRLPKEEPKRRALAETIGMDGVYLLTQLEQASAPAGLAQLEAVKVLRCGRYGPSSIAWSRGAAIGGRRRNCHPPHNGLPHPMIWTHVTAPSAV